MTIPFPVMFRPHRTDDLGFLYSSWMKSLHQGSPVMRRIRWGEFKDVQREIIAKTLDRAAVVVAADPDEDRTIYGWACARGGEEHGSLIYAYVTHTRRRFGVGRSLVEHLGATLGVPVRAYATTTVAGSRFAQRLRLQYDPFSLLRSAHG